MVLCCRLMWFVFETEGSCSYAYDLRARSSRWAASALRTSSPTTNHACKQLYYLCGGIQLVWKAGINVSCVASFARQSDRCWVKTPRQSRPYRGASTIGECQVQNAAPVHNNYCTCIYNLGELFLAVATAWSPKVILFLFPFCFTGGFVLGALGCSSPNVFLLFPFFFRWILVLHCSRLPLPPCFASDAHKNVVFLFFFNDFLVSWEVGGLGRAGVVLFRA